MQAKVFCKTVAKGTQSYFVNVEGKNYFLFSQNFRKSNKEFFAKGVSIDKLNDYSCVHSTSVKKTLDKLHTYLRYIEKEYNVSIYSKRAKNYESDKNHEAKRTPYKREAFRWQDYEWEVA